jgi:hypothetical protein
MTRSFRTGWGVGLSAIVLVGLGCSGGENSAPNTTGAAAVSQTTSAPATSAPTTTISPTATFDTAVGVTLEAASALVELRMNCFNANDLGCLVTNEADMVAAEDAAVATLTAVGDAAAAAGASPEICSGRIDSLVKNLRSERDFLIERARAEQARTGRFGEADSIYVYGRVISRTAAAGHEFALWLLDCINSVRNLDAEHTIARTFGGLVYTSEVRARPSLLQNLWVQYLCVDVPANGDRSCVDTLGQPGPLVSHLEELGYAHEDLLADSGYSGLPAECQAAVDEATARLRSSYDIYLNLSERELVSSDTEMQGLMARGVFQIDDRKRSATAPLYPLDEAMVLGCTAAIARA